MLFNSFHFLVYFPVVAMGYYALRPGRRWMWLLAASSYFYMAFYPPYILILILTILVDYTAGLWIEGSIGRRRKWILAGSIATNVAILGWFKYFSFLDGNLAALGKMIGWNYSLSSLRILLPIGLSFHTFQSMAYTIEVYYGRFRAERHLGMFSLYVLFFPQLVAGPIERPQNLLRQLREHHPFDETLVVQGLRLMLWGFVKKMLIADHLAPLVDASYAQPAHHPGTAFVIPTCLFAYQIYCDFSGYTDIARGSAQVFGIRLMRNFDHPYSAASLTEFWKRWHISLSSWFRDYLYIPMGGNRVNPWRWRLHILVTFVLSGLWHGAAWTYVLWGLVHGLAIVMSSALNPAWARVVQRTGWAGRPALLSRIHIALTFSTVTCAWVFFRAGSVGDAVYIFRHFFLPIPETLGFLFSGTNGALHLRGLIYEYRWALLTIPILEAIQLWQRRAPIKEDFGRQPAWVRWPVYTGAALGLLNLLPFKPLAFIYFQF